MNVRSNLLEFHSNVHTTDYHVARDVHKTTCTRHNFPQHNWRELTQKIAWNLDKGHLNGVINWLGSNIMFRSFPRFDVRHYYRVDYKHAARAARLLKSHARLDGVVWHVVALHGYVRARRRINTKMYAPLHACTRVSDILSSPLFSVPQLFSESGIVIHHSVTTFCTT